MRRIQSFANATRRGLALIAFFLTLWGNFSYAVAVDEADSNDEKSIRKAAKQRLYAGGVDEEPLKVQDQLPAIKKEGDNEAAPSESNDAD